MAPPKHSVVALLALAVGIRALPAGLQQRQGGGVLLPPKYSVSWDNDGSPQPTPEPEEPDYPPFVPTDIISLGKPSGWLSWDNPDPEPTAAPEDPEDPDYPPPSQPTDQISLGKPSFWISWDGPGPVTPTPTPKPEPTPTPKPTPTPEPEYPSFSPPVPSNGTSSVVVPTSPPVTPTPKPSSTQASSSAKKSSSTKKTTKKPKPTPTPTPKPSPKPTPKPTYPSPSDYISHGPPSFSVSWGKRQDEADPEPTEEPFPEDEEPFPEEDPDDFPSIPDQPPADTIGLTPPTATVIWGKKEKKRQQIDTIGLQFPTGFLTIPIARPPTYVSWGKRQDDEDEPAPTAFPEDEEPEDPVITAAPSDQIGLQPPTATVIWGKREAAPAPQQDSIGLGFPWQTVYFPKPNPPSYVSWGRREAAAVAEATAAPEAEREV